MKPNSHPSSLQHKAPRHPSVPIDLYRQVVEELQATKAQLSAVKANNQQLQQEVEQLMHSAHKTQQLVRKSQQQLTSNTPVTKVKPIWQAKSWDSASPQQVVTVKYAARRNFRQSKNSTPINGWVLAIAIMVIILTAFTTGFLLVRPLLNNDN